MEWEIIKYLCLNQGTFPKSSRRPVLYQKRYSICYTLHAALQTYMPIRNNKPNNVAVWFGSHSRVANLQLWNLSR